MLIKRVESEQSFNFQAIIVCVHIFTIGGPVVEESSRAHNNNGTYIH